MKTYKVTIIEKLEKTVEIQAPSRLEAVLLVEQQYRRSDHVLSADDFAGATFTAVLPKRERGMER